jgi:branched-chain amino acid transport system substrate-binding protein
MSKTTKTITAVVVVVVIVTVWIVVNQKSTKDNAIKIGAILSLTGGSSFYGEHAQRGIDFALSKINSSGGINGKSLSIVYEDSQGQPKIGVDAIGKLIAEGTKVIVGGDVSGITLAMAPIAEQNKILLIAPAGAAPAITNAGDYIFRTKVSAAVESKTVAQYIANVLKVKKVAFLYQNSDYGKGVFTPFKADIAAFGVSTIAEENYETDSTDFRTQLTKLKNKSADLIVLAGYPKEVGEILKEAYELGINKTFFAHSGSIGPDIIKVGGDSANGLIYMSEIKLDLNDIATADFYAAYKQKYNEDPEIFSMLGYDTLMVLSDGLKKCSLDSECIKNYLYGVKNYPGITGLISFDQNGDIVRDSFSTYTIQNGQFVPYEE